MRKRYLIFVLVLLVLFCSSCMSLSHPVLGDRPFALKGKVSFIDGDPEKIEYEGARYNAVPYRFLHATEETYSNSVNEGDVLLGWFGFGYVNSYYSNTEESPFFIYESRLGTLYFRDDFDYHTMTFLLEGFDVIVLFSNAFQETDFSYHLLTEYDNETNIVLRLEQLPRLYIKATVFSHNGHWYMVGGETVYELTDMFVEILGQKGIIDQTDA